jgi:hypothetical protein
LAGTLIALAGAASAEAGTYDVMSCGAPGAGGANHSLVGAKTAWEAKDQPTANAGYELDSSCSDGLVARSSPGPLTVTWLSGAEWRFRAPAGTEISKVVSWRFGTAADSPGGDDPATPLVDEGEHWGVYMADHTGQPVGGPAGGETCMHGPGTPSCSVGAPGGTRSEVDVRTSTLSWNVACVGAIVGGCPTSSGGAPLAAMTVYGTQITLTDNSAPTATLGGQLFAGGWRRPSDVATYSAGDNSGIRTAALTVGPVTATDARACDFTYPVPCANAADRPLALPSAPPDGRYTATLAVTDAAGNPQAASQEVLIDGNAPSVSLKRPQRGQVIVGVADRFSGLASGQIQVRNRASEPYRPLPTEFRKGALRAKLDRGSLRRIDVLVTVRDNAGNEASGTPSRFVLTSVTSGGKRRRVHHGQVRVRFGRTARIRGELAFPTGRPLAGVPVSLASTRGGEGTTTTNAKGRFGITVPAGRARLLTIASPGAAGSLRTERTLRLSVPASSTIRASRKRLPGAGRVRFSGRVRDGRRGLIVVLQGRAGGKWRTFADMRAGAGGRWATRYRFSGRAGTYSVRAKIRRQPRLGYDSGYSRVVRVRVG